MEYQVNLSESFNENFSRLDYYARTMTVVWTEKYIDGIGIPRNTIKGLWKYNR